LDNHVWTRITTTSLGRHISVSYSLIAANEQDLYLEPMYLVSLSLVDFTGGRLRVMGPRSGRCCDYFHLLNISAPARHTTQWRHMYNVTFVGHSQPTCPLSLGRPPHRTLDSKLHEDHNNPCAAVNRLHAWSLASSENHSLKGPFGFEVGRMTEA
jgi:hypothetical protein